MSENKGKISHPFLSRLIIRCFCFIPLTLRRALFTAAALMYYHVSPRHRLIALHNLRMSFPEKGMAEIVAIAKGSYLNIAAVGAEFFNIPRLTRDGIKNILEVEGLDGCREALKKDRGLLLFSAHFGNWELSAAAISILLAPLAVLYRPLDNALLDDIIYTVRAFSGNTPLAKDKAMRQMLRFLQNKKIIGILIDQNMARREGVFVDFFSRPASTTDGVAQLALRTDAPVISCFAVRTSAGKYRLIFGREMGIVKTGDGDADVLANTQNFTRAIEDVVRKYPEQWLWVHNRWKTRPGKSK